MSTPRTQTASGRCFDNDVPQNYAGLHVLIAEDRKDCADSLGILLRLYGHEVAFAQNGPNALEMVRTYQPDVILLDIGLPGMDGYEVVKHLREQRETKPSLIIAVTGFGSEADRRHSEEAGIDLHLVKPLDPDHLRAVLGRFQKLLDKRPGEP